MIRHLSLVFAATVTLFSMAGGTGPARPVAAQSDAFAFGVIVDTTDARSTRLAREAGFTHTKMVLRWEAVEPSPGNFLWNSTRENDFDNIMKPARNEGLKLVVRVDGVPGWAGGSPANANLDAVRNFYENAARYGQGTVVAYEILNEPNLDREWGGPPNSAAYTAFLRAAYQGIKAGDPGALVLGGGPAPGTGNNPGATIEDVDFINGMYDAGARDVMDALSVHNYGGNTEPERDPATCTICFRRAEVYREIMEQRGDGDKTVWLTEWGYLMDAGQHMGQYDWMKVSAEQQADYLVRAHRYALEHWPWLGGSLLFNIDGATSPYQNYGGFDAKAWFSILNADYSPRPAFHALQQFGSQALATARPSARQNRRQARTETVASTPAPESTATAPDPALAGPQLRVTGTDGEGLSLRAKPELGAALLKVLPEGTLVLATGESRENDGYFWQRVRDADGTRGWAADQYLIQSQT